MLQALNRLSTFDYVFSPSSKNKWEIKISTFSSLLPQNGQGLVRKKIRQFFQTRQNQIKKVPAGKTHLCLT